MIIIYNSVQFACIKCYIPPKYGRVYNSGQGEYIGHVGWVYYSGLGSVYRTGYWVNSSSFVINVLLLCNILIVVLYCFLLKW